MTAGAFLHQLSGLRSRYSAEQLPLASIALLNIATAAICAAVAIGSPSGSLTFKALNVGFSLTSAYAAVRVLRRPDRAEGLLGRHPARLAMAALLLVAAAQAVGGGYGSPQFLQAVSFTLIGALTLPNWRSLAYGATSAGIYLAAVALTTSVEHLREIDDLGRIPINAAAFVAASGVGGLIAYARRNLRALDVQLRDDQRYLEQIRSALVSVYDRRVAYRSSLEDALTQLKPNESDQRLAGERIEAMLELDRDPLELRFEKERSAAASSGIVLDVAVSVGLGRLNPIIEDLLVDLVRAAVLSVPREQRNGVGHLGIDIARHGGDVATTVRHPRAREGVRFDPALSESLRSTGAKILPSPREGCLMVEIPALPLGLDSQLERIVTRHRALRTPSEEFPPVALQFDLAETHVDDVAENLVRSTVENGLSNVANAIRRGRRVSRVEVSVQGDDGQVAVSVRDFGEPADEGLRIASGGLGRLGGRLRAQGGDLRLEPERDGVLLRATLPVRSVPKRSRELRSARFGRLLFRVIVAVRAFAFLDAVQIAFGGETLPSSGRAKAAVVGVGLVSAGLGIAALRSRRVASRRIGVEAGTSLVATVLGWAWRNPLGFWNSVLAVDVAYSRGARAWAAYALAVATLLGLGVIVEGTPPAAAGRVDVPLSLALVPLVGGAGLLLRAGVRALKRRERSIADTQMQIAILEAASQQHSSQHNVNKQFNRELPDLLDQQQLAPMEAALAELRKATYRLSLVTEITGEPITEMMCRTLRQLLPSVDVAVEEVVDDRTHQTMVEASAPAETVQGAKLVLRQTLVAAVEEVLQALPRDRFGRVLLRSLSLRTTIDDDKLEMVIETEPAPSRSLDRATDALDGVAKELGITIEARPTNPTLALSIYRNGADWGERV